MSIVNIVKVVKNIHPNFITMVRVGKFYHVYGKDAIILAYLFNYQMKKVEVNVNTCGFPEMTLNKVLKTLEDKKINYLIINRSENYEVSEQFDLKDKNKYLEIYNEAYRYISRKNRIDAIYEYFMDNINDDFIKIQIQKVEEIIYETR